MQQLDLLTYQPMSEEMAAPALKVGDRVQYPEGVGKVYYLQPKTVWVEQNNVAKPFDLDQVQPAPTTPINSHALEWHQGNLRYYQQLLIKFFNAAHAATLTGDANPEIQRMRRYEISRLQALCNAETAKIQALKEVP